jgi:hypothetical protein
MHGERRTVLIALVANAVIAVAKGIGGVVTGSSAMLAETAHSIADTVDQVLPLVSLRLGERERRRAAPHGSRDPRQRQRGGREWVAFVVLGIALVSEGTSFVRAFGQTREGARESGYSLVEFVRISKERTTKMVFSEDAVAVAASSSRSWASPYRW